MIAVQLLLSFPLESSKGSAFDGVPFATYGPSIKNWWLPDTVNCYRLNRDCAQCPIYQRLGRSYGETYLQNVIIGLQMFIKLGPLFHSSTELCLMPEAVAKALYLKGEPPTEIDVFSLVGKPNGKIVHYA